MAGLTIAWALQQREVQVTVLERSAVAAGSSWGNAGWITPGLAIPLAEPSVLLQGVRALRDPTAPLHIPLTADPRLWAFLARFAAHCTTATWRRTLAALVPVNQRVLTAYDRLDATVPPDVRSRPGPILAAFTDPAHAEPLLHELELVRSAGLHVPVSEVDAQTLHALVPGLASVVSFGLSLQGQRTIDPGRYVSALAGSVRDQGGVVREGAEVRRLRHGPGGIAVDVLGATPVLADAVVLASGAWMPELAKGYGVRVPLQAGRGYSFTVGAEGAPGGAAAAGDGTGEIQVPVYFPRQRVVASPLADGLRIGGTMEFRPSDAPLDPARIEAIVAAARPLLAGIDLDHRRQQWVGARPVTVDGLPLVGATAAPGVYVHGGHGMWGMCQGPATAELLAEQIVTGSVPSELAPMDPLRSLRARR